MKFLKIFIIAIKILAILKSYIKNNTSKLFIKKIFLNYL